MNVRRPLSWIQAIWLGVGFAALMNVILGYWLGVWPTREPNIGLLGFLVLISFPIGLVSMLLLGLLSDLLSHTPLHVLFANKYLEAVVVWAFITAGGWLQWFVLIPRVVHLVRERIRARGRRAA